MRTIPFLILAWVMLGLEVGIRDALRIGPLPVAPSFVFVLMVVVSMGAPGTHAAWASLALGISVDLASEWNLREGGGVVTLVGPNALAYALASQLVVAMRAMVFRKNPLTVGLLTVLAGLVAGTMLVGIMTLRSAYDPIQWDASAQLGARCASALYTGGLAVVLSPLLLAASSALGFQPTTTRRIRVRTNN